MREWKRVKRGYGNTLAKVTGKLFRGYEDTLVEVTRETIERLRGKLNSGSVHTSLVVLRTLFSG